MSASFAPTQDALIAALAEIERYVTNAGWDQPARLFALVPTAQLLEAEPALAAQLGNPAPGALSAIEQEHFHAGDDLLGTLGQIGWPDQVAGCALALERTFLPMEFEDQLPEDADDAAEFVANHESRQDVRVVVGAVRGGMAHGLARLVSQPDDLLGAQDLVPGLAEALLHTLRDANER